MPQGMAAPDLSPLLHHVVFAVSPQRHAEVAQLFTELGFGFQELELAELGLHVCLDWDRGIELISPIAGSGLVFDVVVNTGPIAR